MEFMFHCALYVFNPVDLVKVVCLKDSLLGPQCGVVRLVAYLLAFCCSTLLHYVSNYEWPETKFMLLI